MSQAEFGGCEEAGSLIQFLLLPLSQWRSGRVIMRVSEKDCCPSFCL